MEPPPPRPPNQKTRGYLYEREMTPVALWAGEMPFPHRARRRTHNDSVAQTTKLAQPLTQDRGLSIRHNVTIVKTKHLLLQKKEEYSSNYSPSPAPWPGWWPARLITIASADILSDAATRCLKDTCTMLIST